MITSHRRTASDFVRWRVYGPVVRSVTSETHFRVSCNRTVIYQLQTAAFPAPDLEISMVKLIALLTTFSAGIFLVYAIEAYSDKAYRAHFSETQDLGVTKPGVDPCDVRNNVEDLTKDCPGFREALKMQDFIMRTEFPP
jgi:hypothetical protein